MVAKTTALIFMMFSLKFLLVAATMFQRTSNSVRGEDNERRMINDISSDRKHTIHEVVQIKFAAGHGGSGHAGGGGRRRHAGGGSGHGGGTHGEGSDGSTKTPGSSSVVPIHGAAGAKVRGHQNHHKSGVRGHTSSLGILSAAISLSLIF